MRHRSTRGKLASRLRLRCDGDHKNALLRVSSRAIADQARTSIIDGEAVACDDYGVASFDLVRHHRANKRIFLYAFDLIELNGDDLRRDPVEGRKAALEMMLAKAGPIASALI
ncbi:MAG: hypothetical protein ACJ74Z_19315 [Bryobacteraceae bacterium]